MGVDEPKVRLSYVFARHGKREVVILRLRQQLDEFPTPLPCSSVHATVKPPYIPGKAKDSPGTAGVISACLRLACPAGPRPGRGSEAPCPRPPPGGAGAARETRPRAVSGLLRPCLRVRGGAKTAARCGSSTADLEDDLQRGK
jgi:hypothetical protein